MTQRSRKIKVEHYRRGYPRLAAFLSLDQNFTIFRKFDNLHMRTLLEQQDRLTELEDALNNFDDEESIQSNLSSRRQDSNLERRALLEQIRVCLKNYSKAVFRFHKLSRLPPVHRRHQRSVENWFNGNRPLVRSESANFMNLASSNDHIALRPNELDRAGFEDIFDTVVVAFPRIARWLSFHKAKTTDPHVFLFPRERIETVFRYLIAAIIPTWLILPGILLNHFPGKVAQGLIFSLFTFAASFYFVFMIKTTKYNLLLAVIAYDTLK